MTKVLHPISVSVLDALMCTQMAIFTLRSLNYSSLITSASTKAISINLKTMVNFLGDVLP